MQRQEVCDQTGRTYADVIRTRLRRASRPLPQVAIQLGDGFTLPSFGVEESWRLGGAGGFPPLYDLPRGAERFIQYGQVGDVPVLVVPRINLHERNPVSEKDMGGAATWVRTVNDTLVFAGCKRLLILTEAGSINAFTPGDLVAIRAVSTIFMPFWPLYQGEAIVPDRRLPKRPGPKVIDALQSAGDSLKLAKHVYWHGPGIETEDDKRVIRGITTAELISMSVLPDLAVWSLHDDVAVLPLALVTNGINNAFDLEYNRRHVAESTERIQKILPALVAALVAEPAGN